MVLLLSAVTLFTGTSPIEMTFYPVLLREMGGGNTELGIAMFVAAFSEVPVLFFFSRFSGGFRLRSLVCASMLCYVVKCLLIALAPTVTILVLSQGLSMFAYGLLLPAAVNYINAITDSRTMVTAQMLYASVTFGVGAIVGNLAGGVLADALGVRQMMFILFTLVVLAFVLFTALTAKDKDPLSVNTQPLT
jgi:MFS family permease